MSFGFGFGFTKITKITAAIGAAFSPSSLFAANEPGVWYDPGDFSTLYQDAAGTTPVTTVEQPVGLMLDKSKGLVPGPELVPQPLNFTSGWGSAGGVTSLTTNSFTVSAAGGPTFTFPDSTMKRYRISLSGTTNVLLRVRNSNNSTYAFDIQPGAFNTTVEASGVLSGGTSLWLVATAAGTVTIDNISVREIPGNYAYQTTATSRPVLSARYNLLTKTEQFDGTAWNMKLNVTFSAAKVIANTVNAEHRVGVSFTSLATSYIHTYRVKPAGLNWCFIRTVSTMGTVDITYFDLHSRAVGTKPANVTAGISAVGDGSYDIYVVNPTGAYNNYSILGLTNADGVQIFAGNGVDGIEVYRADLRVANDGSNLPPYQRVNTATDYDTVGFPHYLRFDGVDDWLVTNTITPGTDKVQVFAGVRKLSSTLGLITESGTNSVSVSGTFGVFSEGPISTTSREYGTSGSGSSGYGKDFAGQLAPATGVLTAQFDIAQALATDEQTLRINSLAAVTNSTYGTTMGTGNFLAYPLYIGRRGGTTFPFNGHLYSLIVRFGNNLTTATIENTEKYINTKTGAY